ncbi:MAG: PEGA domain-containing protein [Deltaproteobacteria bacterium]|nr:PEGA domain-containing protein [Deltaproteobacteria bacterium]
MALLRFNAEMKLPTIIIDMPELERMAARKKVWLVIFYMLAACGFIALSGLIFLELTTGQRETVNAATIEVNNTQASSCKLTVKVVPEQLDGTVVEVDGDVITGNPPYVYLEQSEEYHSIRISAPGYEAIHKDVQVDSSEVLTFALISVDAPEVADASVDENANAEPGDVDSASINGSEMDAAGTALSEVSVDDKTGTPHNGEELALLDKSTLTKRKGGKKSVRGEAERKSAGAQAKGARHRAGAVATRRKDATGTSASESVGKADSTNPFFKKSGTSSTSDDSAVGAAVVRGGEQQTRASLIINAPVNVSSRVRVSVDGKMRGYLPVLIKVEPGLHELTFITEGHRTFQMVKLKPGQIVRVIPNL